MKLFLLSLILTIHNVSFGQQDTIRTTDFITLQKDSANFKNTHVISLNPRTQEKILECNFLNGRTEGIFVVYQNGKVWRQDNFKNGKKDETCFVNFPNGMTDRKEIYENGMFISGNCYDEKGNEIPFFTKPLTYAEQMPIATTDVNKFFRKNIHYSSISKSIEGRTLIQFVVKYDGSIFHPLVLSPIDDASATEIKRVIMMLPPFRPGSQAGKNVNVYYTVPVIL